MKSSIDAVYFSIVTAATVGFGDITPAPGPGRLVVTIEILLSLFFLATVVSYFVSNLTQVEADKMPLKSVVSEAPTQVASSEH